MYGVYLEVYRLNIMMLISEFEVFYRKGKDDIVWKVKSFNTVIIHFGYERPGNSFVSEKNVWNQIYYYWIWITKLL